MSIMNWNTCMNWEICLRNIYHKYRGFDNTDFKCNRCKEIERQAYFWIAIPCKLHAKNTQSESSSPESLTPGTRSLLKIQATNEITWCVISFILYINLITYTTKNLIMRKNDIISASLPYRYVVQTTSTLYLLT